MKARARASRWWSMASETFRPPHGPCPPSNAQLRRSSHDFASTLGEGMVDHHFDLGRGPCRVDPLRSLGIPASWRSAVSLVVDYENVSTAGLESSPVAEA